MDKSGDADGHSPLDSRKPVTSEPAGGAAGRVKGRIRPRGVDLAKMGGGQWLLAPKDGTSGFVRGRASADGTDRCHVASKDHDSRDSWLGKCAFGGTGR